MLLTAPVGFIRQSVLNVKVVRAGKMSRIVSTSRGRSIFRFKSKTTRFRPWAVRKAPSFKKRTKSNYFATNPWNHQRAEKGEKVEKKKLQTSRLSCTFLRIAVCLLSAAERHDVDDLIQTTNAEFHRPSKCMKAMQAEQEQQAREAEERKTKRWQEQVHQRETIPPVPTLVPYSLIRVEYSNCYLHPTSNHRLMHAFFLKKNSSTWREARGDILVDWFLIWESFQDVWHDSEPGPALIKHSRNGRNVDGDPLCWRSESVCQAESWRHWPFLVV
jgi:hypothetical protein